LWEAWFPLHNPLQRRLERFAHTGNGHEQIARAESN